MKVMSDCELISKKTVLGSPHVTCFMLYSHSVAHLGLEAIYLGFFPRFFPLELETINILLGQG